MEGNIIDKITKAVKEIGAEEAVEKTKEKKENKETKKEAKKPVEEKTPKTNAFRAVAMACFFLFLGALIVAGDWFTLIAAIICFIIAGAQAKMFIDSIKTEKSKK